MIEYKQKTNGRQGHLSKCITITSGFIRPQQGSETYINNSIQWFLKQNFKILPKYTLRKNWSSNKS